MTSKGFTHEPPAGGTPNSTQCKRQACEEIATHASGYCSYVCEYPDEEVVNGESLDERNDIVRKSYIEGSYWTSRKREDETMNNENNESNTWNETLTVNGVEYVRADSLRYQPNTGRVVLVITSGWVLAGDSSISENELTGEKEITITRAVGVRSWSGIGFNGLIADPLSDRVVLEPFDARQHVVVPVSSVIYSVPVSKDWGIE